MSQDIQTPEAWNTYWSGDQTGHAYSDHGASQPALSEFWQKNLSSLLLSSEPIRVLDLACGNGALTQLVENLKGSTHVDLHCLDASSAALANVASRIPTVTTVESDMRPIPLADAGFDIVLSQFGTEYAGLDAFDEAARMVSPNGTAVFVIHMQGGIIEAESKYNHDATQALIDSSFLDNTTKVVDLGFAQMGDNSQENALRFKEACVPFNQSIAAVESILTDYGVNVAAGTIHKLYNDVANIVENLAKYDQNEVGQWLTGMASELAAYQLRMQSMLNAAIDQDQFDLLKENFEEKGFSVSIAGPIIDTAQDVHLCWAFKAQRTS